jgi:hypothetical protein
MELIVTPAYELNELSYTAQETAFNEFLNSYQ